MEQTTNDLALQKLLADAEKKRKKESARQFWHVFFGRGLYSKICFGILLMNAFAPIIDRWSWHLWHRLTHKRRTREEVTDG